MEHSLIILGLGLAACTLAVLIWSIAVPSRRIWPPKRFGAIVLAFVWVPTIALFAILIALGILGWGDIALPGWLRYGLGLALIAVGNVAVWSEVRKFGVNQTSGAKGSLRTDGLYRFSRHPQYVADALIVFGWMMLSASVTAMPVGLGIIVLFLTAPLAEESWLREAYGSQYDDYTQRVRRYL
jgi:protein-S-isoprenylcysteine O-methyltransferase Ste14